MSGTSLAQSCTPLVCNLSLGAPGPCPYRSPNTTTPNSSGGIGDFFPPWRTPSPRPVPQSPTIYGYHRHEQPVLTSRPQSPQSMYTHESPIHSPTDIHTPTHIPITMPPSPIYAHPYSTSQLHTLAQIYTQYDHLNDTYLYQQYALLTYPSPYPLLHM